MEYIIPDEKKLFSRMAEVFAGFSEYTDVQIGRVINYLEESGQLENTWFFIVPITALPAKEVPMAR
jgi:arylsulfatase A-like enzyme